jgi:hypothetical protein
MKNLSKAFIILSALNLLNCRFDKMEYIDYEKVLSNHSILYKLPKETEIKQDSIYSEKYYNYFRLISRNPKFGSIWMIVGNGFENNEYVYDAVNRFDKSLDELKRYYLNSYSKQYISLEIDEFNSLQFWTYISNLGPGLVSIRSECKIDGIIISLSSVVNIGAGFNFDISKRNHYEILKSIKLKKK